MMIYPAIDIKDGRCVRLKQGKFDDITVYYENPAEAAALWKGKGAKYIHIVDLDGALEGVPKNLEVIREIANGVDIPVQIGGGIRSRQTVDLLLSAGVRRVIVGTMAVKNRELLEELVKEYGDKIVVGIDAKDGKVAVEGWEEVSSIDSIELASELSTVGVKTVIYTDISKDGMMSGPNFEVYGELKEKTSLEVIASGGISSAEDIKKLAAMGVDGAIVGKALYSGAIDFEDLKNL
ncbi:MAG: 1-(5-phosphoribosyl)-5-[(5-phosphoribosylamino)methylideneamino]imidazole-4-carboxamide isomerase [Peptoclostridium sp.]|uniref:1-(5-phosphoribosyl)-5-[(5- phosphoribosylamino)methylideneamino]imidazole-4- carboxamide isomerase n=1 Tax=Peptoclostridium sp. TaxID=1904860 RepID=UPI00139B75F6|nr:1-(5-phosphoribosyl)-5-[(5-phosphoribosylamino)methylideneamino]imidazole-4-carboxamide isomerase [Peptoclostridium sp.]MZQ75085.1 1-(5-phosphoribosyl)-5-[(5-phosphoribosylamino)methylideneamino]imidazole-4-carboxamide isomerase [Peptoclostridium sp.]